MPSLAIPPHLRRLASQARAGLWNWPASVSHVAAPAATFAQPVAGAGAAWTYDQLWQRVASFAAAMKQSGVLPGHRVMCQADKSLDVLAAGLACQAIGGIWVPLNTAYGAEEVEYFLQDAEPDIVLVDSPTSSALAAAAAAHKVSGTSVWSMDARAEDGLLARAAEHMQVDLAALSANVEQQSIASLVYTSGTTGQPKGAQVTHGM